MTCPRCSKTVYADWSYCTACGAALREEPVEPPRIGDYWGLPTPLSALLVVVALLVCVGIAVLLSVAYAVS